MRKRMGLGLLMALICVGALFAVFRHLSAQQDTGSEPLEGAEPQNVKDAIDLIRSMGSYDTIADNLANALEGKDKKGKVKEPRIRKGQPKGVGGSTVGYSDKPWNKTVILSQAYLNPPDGKKDPMFISLVDIAFHEGVHLGQNNPNPPEHLGTAGGLAWKEKRIENELEAYTEGRAFKLRIAGALAQMWTNAAADRDPMDSGPDGDPVPPWAGIWKTCDKAQLSSLLGMATLEAGTYQLNIKSLSEFQVEIQEKKYHDPPMKVVDIVKQINAHDTWKHFRLGVNNYLIDSRSSEVGGAGPNGGKLETGIPHPQDIMILTDCSGVRWLVVCGVNQERNPCGTIRAFPELKRPGGEPPRKRSAEAAPDLLGFDAAQGKTIITDDPRLGRATSVFAAPGGRAYVWDVEATALYGMIDGDHDGIPDQVDFQAGSLVRVAPGLHMDHFAAVDWMGGQPIAYMRVLDIIVGGPLRIFRDVNNDGYFEAILPMDAASVPEKDKEK
jgi:hypothetical protein